MAQARDVYNSDVVEIDLLGSLRKHLRLVIILPIITMVVGGLVAYFLPDEYTAETTMYVLSRNDSDAGTTTSSSTTQSDLSAGQMISNDVADLIKSDRVKTDVAQQLGMASLSGYDLNVTNSSDSRVVTLSVTGRDPQVAAQVANAIVSDVSGVAADVMHVEAVNVIDEATVPQHPSGPNRLMYALVGLAIGLVSAIAIAVLRDTLDKRVTSGEEVEELIDVPVIGHFQELRG